MGTTEGHGIDITTSNGSRTSKSGMLIKPEIDATLTAVTKNSDCTAARAYVQSDYTTVLAQADFSGDVATFSYAMTANTEYWILVDQGDGANYDMRISAVGSYLPIDSGNIVWTKYCNQQGELGTNYTANVESVTYELAGTNTQINIGDAWKEISAAQINIGDAWKEVASMQINIGDSWKEVF